MEIKKNVKIITEKFIKIEESHTFKFYSSIEKLD